MDSIIPPVPSAITNTGKPFVLVEYVGAKLGNFRLRGASGTGYKFSAKSSGYLQWVRCDDAEKICAQRDFLLRHETRVDPDEERHRTMVEETVLAMLGTISPQHMQLRAVTGRGGRPRIDSDLQLLCLHLAHHCEPAWTPADLAAAYIKADLQRPTEAMSTRIRRFSREHPEAVDGGAQHCRFCADDHCPEPPDPPPDTG